MNASYNSSLNNDGQDSLNSSTGSQGTESS